VSFQVKFDPTIKFDQKLSGLRIMIKCSSFATISLNL
jgi:hypothetical protein